MPRCFTGFYRGSFLVWLLFTNVNVTGERLAFYSLRDCGIKAPQRFLCCELDLGRLVVQFL